MKTTVGKISVKNILLLFILFVFSTGCSEGKKSPEDTTESSDTAKANKLSESSTDDLEEIKKRGVLRAITMYSSTSYFIYKGKPMGYEYELLSKLAEHLGVELDIIIENDLSKSEYLLKNGKGDIIAHRLTITKDRKKRLDFTDYHTQTRQVLVQKKPANWRKMKLHEIEKKLVRNPIDLIGKKIHVKKKSSYYKRLRNLSEEIGGDIKIITADPEVVTEELIEEVAKGKIKYTVADRNIALLNRTYHPILDVKTELSFPQRIAWAMRKNTTKLKKAVNAWIDSMKKKPAYYTIYNKYFKSLKTQKYRASSEFHSRKGNRISRFDKIIKKYADKIDWDWKLLASQIYQESKFNPEAESWAGAQGVMQLMPKTASQLGIKDLSDPEQSIKAGTKYLELLNESFKSIDNKNNRIKFVLAAYNVGKGHLEDARRLAKAYKADKDIWENSVEKYLKLKSKPEFYNNPVVKYGYCRGSEPVNYVTEILKRYNHYKKLMNE